MSRHSEVSQRFIDAVGTGGYQLVNDIRYSNEDGVWSDPLQLVEGSVTEDATSQVRWTCDLLLRGPLVNGWFEERLEVGDDGINNWHSHLRILHGMDFGGSRELIGMGVYRVDNVSRDTDDPSIVHVQGVSFEQRVIDAEFGTPRVLAASDPIGRAQTLIANVIPGAELVVDPRIDTDIWLPKMPVETDRWGVIDGGPTDGSVAKSLGGRIYTDGYGTFICAPTPSINDAPQWTVHKGEGGVLIKAVEALDVARVRNQIRGSGESRFGGAPVGPILVSDDDPFSRTYIYGRFGPRPMDWTSQQVVDENQLRRACRGILLPRLGLRQQIEFDSLHDPLKSAGDVGAIETPSGVQNAILDSVTHNLLGGPLQATTRVTITRTGGLADEPDDEGVSL